MRKNELCICGNKIFKSGICEECLYLLRAKKSKNIAIIEKFRAEYNSKNDVHKTYGQFVGLLDMIDRRKKYFDNRRKKDSFKKVRRNR